MNEDSVLFPQYPLYLFLDTGFVEKIKADWLKKNEHITCLISSEGKVLYSNVDHPEELGFIKKIQEDYINVFRGLVVVSNSGMPYYSTLISLVDRLAKLRYCNNLKMDSCSQFKIFKTTKDELILLTSFDTKGE